MGDVLPPSRIWDDNNPTDDVLPGTSALGLQAYVDTWDRKHLERVIRLASVYRPFGPHVYLVCGRPADSAGEDIGEIVLQHATVLAVIC